MLRGDHIVPVHRKTAVKVLRVDSHVTSAFLREAVAHLRMNRTISQGPTERMKETHRVAGLAKRIALVETHLGMDSMLRP